MHSSVVGGQIGAEMNVHGSRATGWSSGWKWNSSICKVGVAVEAARLIQALERGWALGRHHVGAGVLLVGNCLAAYPPPMLDPPPAVLQIHWDALLCTGLRSLTRSSQLDFCVPPPPAITLCHCALVPAPHTIIMHRHSPITSCARKYQSMPMIRVQDSYVSLWNINCCRALSEGGLSLNILPFHLFETIWIHWSLLDFLDSVGFGWILVGDSVKFSRTRSLWCCTAEEWESIITQRDSLWFFGRIVDRNCGSW